MILFCWLLTSETYRKLPYLSVCVGGVWGSVNHLDRGGAEKIYPILCRFWQYFFCSDGKKQKFCQVMENWLEILPCGLVSQSLVVRDSFPGYFLLCNLTLQMNVFNPSSYFNDLPFWIRPMLCELLSLKQGCFPATSQEKNYVYPFGVEHCFKTLLKSAFYRSGKNVDFRALFIQLIAFDE